MLAQKLRKVKQGCQVSKVMVRRKGNVARMGPLVTKENQEQRGQLDPQELPFRQVREETRGPGGSVALLEREDRKATEGIRDLPAFREGWAFQE